MSISNKMNPSNKKRYSTQSNSLEIKDIKINIHSSFSPQKSLSDAMLTLANAKLKEKSA